MTAHSDAEALANEWLATGALFVALRQGGDVDVERVTTSEDTAAMIVRFPFLKSAYRVTVTMESDDA